MSGNWSWAQLFMVLNVMLPSTKSHRPLCGCTVDAVLVHFKDMVCTFRTWYVFLERGIKGRGRVGYKVKGKKKVKRKGKRKDIYI